ncbi:winged helix-turn-helix domain-containing protein [Crossiella sp. SN42]|uniref:BTAD domain-containing putative transcriptional regulator n=1 Tax=Crossiella sp. SN42 TaxID=2944808 RepID=UPI00207C7C26|nr:BTAD domain-containing putative transcriptional regulator [Crossiella sp. SN42]MCO1577181.1 winged helix-turn-helix domain-containing protein [Crossiella sp. SN42]
MLRVEVLGPVRAFGADGVPVELAGARLRALLARLALSAGRVVPAEVLLADIWGADGVPNTLHALVHRLRRALPAGAVESLPAGYRLALPAHIVDAHRFEQLAAQGRRELEDPARAAGTLAEALELWQGTAFADVDAVFAEAAGARLAELRAGAAEDRFEAELRLGRSGELLADLEAACAARPLRERLIGLRMRALAAAGRQSEALAVYEQARGRLAEDLGVDPSAELRGVQLAVLRGELDRTGPAPGRLPARLTSFVGREGELALLAGLLDSARLVTVTGPGGVGKTSLAVAAAARHRAHRDGRLWLVPLAAVEHPAGIATAILGALSAGDRSGGSGDPLARVAALLGTGDAVLVLDNCEHLAAGAAEVVRALLEARPRLTVLATSREPLEIIGEALCRLGPLALPPEGSAESPAVRLFLDRAAAVRPGFALDESTVDDVLQVVRQLDGLPLALELAAARLRSMDIGQIARRLDDRFRLLATGNRAALPRQRTLRAVIEWSWELLTEAERALARRLSFFPAAAGAEAVEAVCAEGASAYLLDALVDRSLVERTGSGYRMLESIRAFAAEELTEAERARIRARFTAHYAALAAEHEPLVRTAAQAGSLPLVTAEYGNLVFALRSALNSRDAPAVAQLFGLLHWYWYAFRYDARTESFLAEALTLGAALPAETRAALAALDALIGAHSPSTDPALVRALIEDCLRTGAHERYPLLFTVTQPVAHRLGLTDLAETLHRRAQPDPWAAAVLALLAAEPDAAERFAATGDRLWTAVALALGAQAHSLRGDHATAIADAARAIELAAGAESQHDVPFLVLLATLRLRAGDLPGAARELDTAEQLTEIRGLRHTALELWRGRAELHRRAGEFDRSRQALARLAGLAEQLCLPEADRLLAPARLALRLSEGGPARALFPAALAAAVANGEPATAAQLLARLRHQEGDHPGAATALGLSQALRGSFDHGDPELRSLIAQLTAGLGETAYHQAFQLGAELSAESALTRLADPVSAV